MNLTAKNFRALLTQPGRYRDKTGEVRGLMLVVRNANNASWQLRYELNGKEHWHGLGSARLVGLAVARNRARAARLKLLDGIDPLAAKQSAKAEAAAAARKAMTFEQAATAYAETNETRWGHPRHRAQFLSSMRQYVFPVIGSTSVADVDTGAVLRVLEQPVAAERGKPAGRFWDSRAETAARVMRRMAAVLDWSRVRGFRTGDNPAAWRGHLAGVLPAARPASRHMPALPYAEAAAFMAALRARSTVAARALEFTICTPPPHVRMRPSELRGPRSISTLASGPFPASA